MSESNAQNEGQNEARPQQDISAKYLSEVPFSLTPAHVLAAASLPLCIGTYIGFKRQLKIVEKEARAAHLEQEISIALTRESKSVARRALGIGTMLSVSTFGLVGAGEYHKEEGPITFFFCLLIYQTIHPIIQLCSTQVAFVLGRKLSLVCTNGAHESEVSLKTFLG